MSACTYLNILKIDNIIFLFSLDAVGWIKWRAVVRQIVVIWWTGQLVEKYDRKDSDR